MTSVALVFSVSTQNTTRYCRCDKDSPLQILCKIHKVHTIYVLTRVLQINSRVLSQRHEFTPFWQRFLRSSILIGIHHNSVNSVICSVILFRFYRLAA